MTLVDFSVSRTFKSGSRRIVPPFDIFNLTNAATADAINNGVGGTYLVPTSIVAPRIAKIAVVVGF